MCRDELPRIFELRDLLPADLPSEAYFQRFEASLAEFPPKKKVFRHLESELQRLDSNAWAHLKSKLKPLLSRKHPTRGWQPLFDAMNEAKAYAYLSSIGCTGIAFIPESHHKTPDLMASLEDQAVLCEVKTINISEDESQARRHQRSREMSATLSEKFYLKLKSDLDNAKEQLATAPSVGGVRKFIYIVINFDESLHEYAALYKKEIDSYISRNVSDNLTIVLDIKPPFYTATSE